MFGQHSVGVAAVEIVRVDGRELFLDGVFRHQNRVRGAPRLGAAGGHGEAGRQFIEFLKSVIHLDAVFEARADNFAERLFDVVADDEHKLAEAGAQRVEDGIINDGFAAGADGINLFQTAVTAAHAGGENEQNRFCHAPEI